MEIKQEITYIRGNLDHLPYWPCFTPGSSFWKDFTEMESVFVRQGPRQFRFGKGLRNHVHCPKSLYLGYQTGHHNLGFS